MNRTVLNGLIVILLTAAVITVHILVAHTGVSQQTDQNYPSDQEQNRTEQEKRSGPENRNSVSLPRMAVNRKSERSGEGQAADQNKNTIREDYRAADTDRNERTGSSNPGSGSADSRQNKTGTAAGEREIAYARDTSVPLKKRRDRLNILAASGTDENVRALMAVADAEIYMRRYALESLGRVKNSSMRSEIAAFFVKHLDHTDAVQVCESARAIANVQGEEAVEPLIETLKKNRTREDGHQQMVQTAVVEALGGIGSPKAVSALASELERSGEKGWNLEYGSSVLAALVLCDSAQARKAAAAYAERLSKSIPEDPMARTYVERKIKEARAAARGEYKPDQP